LAIEKTFTQMVGTPQYIAPEMYEIGIDEKGR
jgi:hypothetical protein